MSAQFDLSAEPVAVLGADGALVDYGGGEPEIAGRFRSHPGQPEEVVTGAVVRLPANPRIHPDDALLDHCASLREEQLEWQRLWDLTPEEPGSEVTAADEAWEAYSDDVWPCGPEFGKLLHLPATTPEGCRAKAVAILAAEEAGDYLGRDHDDQCRITRQLLIEMAGDGRQLVGTSRPLDGS